MSYLHLFLHQQQVIAHKLNTSTSTTSVDMSTTTSSSSSNCEDVVLWQDREVRLNIPSSQLASRPGEKMLDKLESTEDTQGGLHERGRIYATNLRIIWQSRLYQRINMSIGYNCITEMRRKSTKCDVKGVIEALHVDTKTKESTTRMAFTFSSAMPGAPRIYKHILSIFRAYETSKAYREVKLRCALINNNNNKGLRLLPLEQIYERITGMWNLATEQGNLGVMFVTNVRVVWHATLNTSFNVSIPYIQLKSIRVQQSKFGVVLILETTSEGGGLVLGFRMDPVEKITEVAIQLKKLHKIYTAWPIFGVESDTSTKQEDIGEEDLGKDTIDDESEFLDDDDDELSPCGHEAYFVGGGGGEPEYNRDLGLAVEKLKDGFTLKCLWEVIPS